jgi:hypothetical protein
MVQSLLKSIPNCRNWMKGSSATELYTRPVVPKPAEVRMVGQTKELRAVLELPFPSLGDHESLETVRSRC